MDDDQHSGVGAVTGGDKMKLPNVRTQYQNVIVFVLTMFLAVSCTASTGQVANPTMTPSNPATSIPSLTRPPSPSLVVNTPVTTRTPTLTPEQEKAFVIDALTNNGGCELPCWWGIVPGESTLATLVSKFGFYGNSFSQQDGSMLYDGPYFAIRDSAGLDDYYVNLQFFERNGVLQSIKVSSQALTKSKNFSQDWRRYSIDQVLARYGTPSRIQVQFVPGASPGYALTLVYEPSGFWIRYQGPATYDGAMVRACPTFTEMKYIVLELQSPVAKAPVFQPDPAGYDRSLEEATGMSLKMFHDSFRNANTQTCLEGPPTLP